MDIPVTKVDNYDHDDERFIRVARMKMKSGDTILVRYDDGENHSDGVGRLSVEIMGSKTRGISELNEHGEFSVNGVMGSEQKATLEAALKVLKRDMAFDSQLKPPSEHLSAAAAAAYKIVPPVPAKGPSQDPTLVPRD